MVQSKLWRLVFEEVNGSSSLCSASEVAFYEGASRIQQTLSASSSYSPAYNATYANDEASGTFWRSAAAQHLNSWIQSEFATDKSPSSFAITCTGNTDEAPSKVWVEVSIDSGVSWSRVCGVSGLTDWTSYSTKTFAIKQKPVSALGRSMRGAKAYRIRPVTGGTYGGTDVLFKHASYAEYAGGPDIAFASATPIGTSSGAPDAGVGFDMAIAAYAQSDRSNSGNWWRSVGTPYGWCGAEFQRLTGIRELRLLAGDQYANMAPQTFAVDYTLDGIAWFQLSVHDWAAVNDSWTTFSLPVAGYEAPHKFWRVKVLQARKDSASPVSVKLAKVEMAAVPGGASVCTGGTPIASGTVTPGLFTGATPWVSESADGGQWVGYEFASPQVVQELRVTIAEASQAPHTYTIQFSDNGKLWNDYGPMFQQASWVDSQSRSDAFWDDSVDAEAAYRLWELSLPATSQSNLASTTGRLSYFQHADLKSIAFKDEANQPVTPESMWTACSLFGHNRVFKDAAGTPAYSQGVTQTSYLGRDALHFAGWASDDRDDYIGSSVVYSDSDTLVLGCNDFTFELEFAFAGQNPYTNNPRLAGFGDFNSTYPNLIVLLNNSGQVWVQISATSDIGPNIVTTTRYDDAAWHHMAFVRQGNVGKLYMDGVQFGTTLALDGVFFTGRNLILGRPMGQVANDQNLQDGKFIGFMRNVRLTQGKAVYTAGFTPSSAAKEVLPLHKLDVQYEQNPSSITGLFTFDNSLTPLWGTLTLSVTGAAVSYSTAQKMFGTHSLSLPGGAGNYLSATVASGDSNVCYEGWFNPSASGAIFEASSSSSAGSDSAVEFGVSYDSTAHGWTLHSRGAVAYSDVLAAGFDHVAVVRSGSTLHLYIEGVHMASLPVNYPIAPVCFRLGVCGSISGAPCLVDVVRVLNGTRYSSDFVPPASAPTQATESWLPDHVHTVPFDANYWLVMALMHFNGTNGSTAFVEERGWTPTYGGNAVISTSKQLFGQPTLALDGNGDYVELMPYQACSLGDTYTLEAWINPSAYPTGPYAPIFGHAHNQSAGETVLYLATDGKLGYNLGTPGASVRGMLSSTTIPLNQWTHCALSVSAGNAKMFINGVLVGEGTSFSWIAKTHIGLRVGMCQVAAYSSYWYFTGNIAEPRVTRGVARYAENFLPPTAQYPGPGTKSYPLLDASFASVKALLKFDGNTGATNFTEVGGKVVSAVGSPALSNLSRVIGSTSLLLNGSSAVTLPSSTDFDLNTAAWTIEGWYMATQAGGALVSRRSSGANGWALLTNSFKANINGAGFGDAITWFAPALNVWHHFALVKSSGVITYYVDGVVMGSVAAATISDEAQPLRIGADAAASPVFLSGNIDEFRFTQGVARYTAAFTPVAAPFPTATTATLGKGCPMALHGGEYIPDPASLLLNPPPPLVIGSKVYDTTVGLVGGATATRSVSGNVALWGAAAPLANGGRVFMPPRAGFDFGTGDFTIELVWRVPEVVMNNTDLTLISVDRGGPYGAESDVNGEWLLRIAAGNVPHIRFYIRTGGGWQVFNTTADLLRSDNPKAYNGQYVHIAVTRKSGTLYFYLNGILAGSWAMAFSVGVASRGIVLNSDHPASNYNTDYSYEVLGHVSDVRIIKGVAKYFGDVASDKASFQPLQSVGADPYAGDLAVLARDVSYGMEDAKSHPHRSETYGAGQRPYIATDQSVFGSSIKFGLLCGLLYDPSPDWDIWGGDFTFETRVRFKTLNTRGVSLLGLSDSTAYLPFCVSIGGASGTNGWVAGNAYKIVVSKRDAGNTLSTLLTSTNPVVAGQWYGLCVEKQGSFLRLYVDGVKVVETTLSGTYLTTTGRWLTLGCQKNPAAGSAGIGEGLDGWMEEVRLTKGVARYAGSNYTLAASRFPANSSDPSWASVVLLVSGNGASMDGSNVFDDLVGHTASVSGTAPGVIASGPLGTAAQFNGAWGALQYSQLTSEYAFGTGDFTIEVWVYPLSGYSGGNRSLMTFRNSWVWWWWTNGTMSIHGVTNHVTVPKDSWHHVAFMRKSGVVYSFLDGVMVGSVANAITMSSGLGIFELGNSGYDSGNHWPFAGYISGVRISNSARYNEVSGFVPYTAQPAVDGNTIISIPCRTAAADTGVPATDETGGVLVASGSSLVPGGVNGRGWYFGGVGYGVKLPNPRKSGAYGDDFTIEFNFLPMSFAAERHLISNHAPQLKETMVIGINTSGKLFVSVAGNHRFTALNALTADNWYSLVFQRKNGVLILLVNGKIVLGWQDSRDMHWGTARQLTIGGCEYYGSTYSFLGWVSDVRISARARYTTPVMPTAQFSTADSDWVSTVALLQARTDVVAGSPYSVVDRVGIAPIPAPTTRIFPFKNRKVVCDFGKAVSLKEVSMLLPDTAPSFSPAITATLAAGFPASTQRVSAAFSAETPGRGSTVKLSPTAARATSNTSAHRYWRVVVEEAASPARDTTPTLDSALWLYDDHSCPAGVEERVWSSSGIRVATSGAGRVDEGWEAGFQYTTSGVATKPRNQWIAVDCTVPVAPSKLVLRWGYYAPKSGTSYDGAKPVKVQVQFSDNGTSWTSYCYAAVPAGTNPYGDSNEISLADLHVSGSTVLLDGALSRTLHAVNDDAADSSVLGMHDLPQHMLDRHPAHIRRQILASSTSYEYLPQPKRGRIEGVVSIEGYAAKRRVILLEYRSGTIIDSVWSDDTGVYVFDGLDPDLAYLAISQDYAKQYNAVVQDAISPEKL